MYGHAWLTIQAVWALIQVVLVDVIFVVRFVYLLSVFLITLLGCTKFFVATNNVLMY